MAPYFFSFLSFNYLFIYLFSYVFLNNNKVKRLGFLKVDFNCNCDEEYIDVRKHAARLCLLL